MTNMSYVSRGSDEGDCVTDGEFVAIRGTTCGDGLDNLVHLLLCRFVLGGVVVVPSRRPRQ